MNSTKKLLLIAGMSFTIGSAQALFDCTKSACSNAKTDDKEIIKNCFVSKKIANVDAMTYKDIDLEMTFKKNPNCAKAFIEKKNCSGEQCSLLHAAIDKTKQTLKKDYTDSCMKTYGSDAKELQKLFEAIKYEFKTQGKEPPESNQELLEQAQIKVQFTCVKNYDSGFQVCLKKYKDENYCKTIGVKDFSNPKPK